MIYNAGHNLENIIDTCCTQNRNVNKPAAILLRGGLRQQRFMFSHGLMCI